MPSPTLVISRSDNILHVLIDRPEKRNALSQQVLAEIGAVFLAHAGDETLIAATLTGAGERCFAAGGDLKEFDGLRSREATADMARAASAALDTIRDFPVPVVALLNGDAIGGGAELAAACDMRVFAAHARIAFVQGSMCISPAWGGGADLVRLVGGGRALRLLARAEFVDARAAYELGLADAVEPSGHAFPEFVAEFLAAIKPRKPQVMRAFKSLVCAMRKGGDWHRIRDLETALLLETWSHPDHWAAAEAVLARIGGANP